MKDSRKEKRLKGNKKRSSKSLKEKSNFALAFKKKKSLKAIQIL